MFFLAGGCWPVVTCVHLWPYAGPRQEYFLNSRLPLFTVANVSIESDGNADYPGQMSEEDIARFRSQAEECRQQAERAVNPLDKEFLAPNGG